MNYISAILYLATTDKYYCRIVVAFDEAHVIVGTSPLYALYTHRNVVVCVPRAHIAFTSQRIRLHVTCTLRIHIATYSFVFHVYTSQRIRLYSTCTHRIVQLEDLQ